MIRASSNRNASRRKHTRFLHETFSGFSQTALVIHKTSRLSAEKSQEAFRLRITFWQEKGFGTVTIPELDSEFSQVPLAYSVHVGEKIADRSAHLHDDDFVNYAGPADG